MSAVVHAIVSNALIALLLAVLVFSICRVRRIRLRPALAHLLWLLVLVKMVTPPLVLLPVLPSSPTGDPSALDATVAAATDENAVDGDGLAASLASARQSGATEESPPGRFAGLPLSWPIMLATVWLAGTATLAVLGLWQIRRVTQLLSRAAGADEDLQLLAAAMARRFKLKRTPEIRVVRASVTPLLLVTPRGPLIVLPQSLLATLDQRQKEDVIAHELAHYVRGDHLTGAFCFLMATLFWWHPVVWWARREIRTAQELCCDAIVLCRCPGRKRQYAETLLRAVDFVSREDPLLPELASGFGQVSSLKRRFEMLMNPKLNHRVSYWTYPLLLLVVATLPCAAVRAAAEEKADKDTCKTGVANVRVFVNGQEIKSEGSNAGPRVHVAQVAIGAAQPTSEQREEMEKRRAEWAQAAKKRQQEWLESLTPEQREAHEKRLAEQKERMETWNKMTPEQRAAEIKKRQEEAKKQYEAWQKMTPEERAAQINKRNEEYMKKLTPEQREAYKKQLEQAEKWRTMTPEDRAAEIKKRQEEYMKKLTPEQREAHKKRLEEAEKWQKMTPEERDAVIKRRQEEYLKSLTPEQREAHEKRQEEYKKRMEQWQKMTPEERAKKGQGFFSAQAVPLRVVAVQAKPAEAVKKCEPAPKQCEAPKKMTPEQREAAIKKHREETLKQMTPEQKAEIQKRRAEWAKKMEAWKNMTPEQREAAMKKHREEMLKKMTPEQKAEMEKRHAEHEKRMEAWKNMTPEEREAAAKKHREQWLKSLTPEKRAELEKRHAEMLKKMEAMKKQREEASKKGEAANENAS